MDIPVELTRILITEMGMQQVIFLREKAAGRVFPIMIGTNEALAIDRRLKGVPTPRPMTHDLLADVIQAMGGAIEKVVVDDLREGTFIATIHLRQGGRLLAIDARPSDAIALGVAFDTPLFVADHVIEEVLREPSADEKINMLRQRAEMLQEHIAELTEQLGDDDYTAQAPESILDEQRRQLADMRNEFEQLTRILRKLDG
jgi:hypothetical protein